MEKQARRYRNPASNKKLEKTTGMPINNLGKPKNIERGKNQHQPNPFLLWMESPTAFKP